MDVTLRYLHVERAFSVLAVSTICLAVIRGLGMDFRSAHVHRTSPTGAIGSASQLQNCTESDVAGVVKLT